MTGSQPIPDIEAQALLAAVVDSSEDAIITKTLDSVVTTWNAAAERLFGWTASEMIGESILKLIPADLQHEEVEILAKLREGERIERYETVRRHKSGDPLEISLTVSPVRNAAGKIIGAAKVAHDITARRRAERAAAAEAQALETLNRVGKAVSSQLELERIVQVVTDEARALCGAEVGAFFYNAPTRGAESYWLYTLSGVPREAFEGFPHPRMTEVFAPTFRGEGIVSSPDITQDPRYGKMAPHFGMPHGHVPIRSYLAVPVISSTGTVLGGLFVGHSMAGVFDARSQRNVGALAGQAAIAIDNARLFQRLKDRETELEELAAEREKILDAERSARSETERMSRMKDEFLATLSHELRTPLNAIQGWNALLLAKPRDDEDTKALRTVERNVRAQAKIISDLLDMSRIISGKIHLEVQPLHLDECVEAAMAAVQQSADAKKIRVRTMLDSSIGQVKGDPSRLQQVLWNLLSNAVKFTPAGGSISVVLERVNSHVEIVVQDSGIGITADLLPYVFDRFRQGDASTSRHFGGLGLGLSIVKSLVEMHGGSVRVKSPGENQGSTFIVALPVMHVRSGAADVPASTRRQDPPELPLLGGARVLVVDDEPDGAALLARILENRGATVVTAANGPAALALLREEPFDFLLSDVGMPGMDGYELIATLRASELQNRRVPAIAVTAYARPEDRQQALLAGFQMHIAKPIEALELIAGVASLLQIKQ